MLNNNFEEFGFAANFAGEILKKVEQPQNMSHTTYVYIGYVVGGNGLKYPCVWSIFGQCGLCTSSQERKYDLKPIN